MTVETRSVWEIVGDTQKYPEDVRSLIGQLAETIYNQPKLTQMCREIAVRIAAEYQS